MAPSLFGFEKCFSWIYVFFPEKERSKLPPDRSTGVGSEEQDDVPNIPIPRPQPILDDYTNDLPPLQLPDDLGAAHSPIGSIGRSPFDKHFWRRKSLRGLFSVVDMAPIMAGTVELNAREQVVESSMDVLRMNDLGGYTVPAKGLYPFQTHVTCPSGKKGNRYPLTQAAGVWNWDSAIVAAGWAVFDEARAWEEVATLMQGQWDDGMVPSILFHKEADTYFPGPEIWGTAENPSKTTGISQPPVAAMSVRFLYEHAEQPELAQRKIEELFPKLLAYHRWWYKARDPEGRGVVAILHPWESGMDNSPAWDDAMQFPVGGFPAYTRRDLNHVNPEMRPTKDTYDHYLTLLYLFKKTNFYDSNQLYHISPFRMTDLCVNCILFRANRDLRWVASKLGKHEVAAEIDGWLDKGFAGFQQLWDEEAGIFKCQDQLTGKLADAAISAGFLPLFAGVATKEQAARMAANLERWLTMVRYGVPSTDPADPRFEPLRYWRGPVWIIINWMISNGLKHYGYFDLADRIKQDSLELTGTAGLLEYFDPVTGQGAGGHHFSWTAAMCLAWLDRPGAAIGHKMSGPKKHLETGLGELAESPPLLQS
eukprot:jgi/Mesen1/10298/ME000079S09719